MDAVWGIIDGTISFCPYCGSELSMTSFTDETQCEDCGQSFYVIEGDSEV